MDESAPVAPGMPESRTGAFSLGQDSAKYNAMVPKGIGQMSVLQPYRPSGNGMSDTDYERVLPGGTTLPTANGSAALTSRPCTCGFRAIQRDMR